jgi:hypothetical protein
MFDFNDADTQRDNSPVPAGIYRLKAKVNAGAMDVLTLAKSLRTKHLELELTIVEPADFAKRKIWDRITCEFVEDADADAEAPITSEQAERFRTAVRIGRSKIRAMLESARNIDPTDNSDAAQARRCIDDYLELDGLVFWAEVEIRKGANGYRDSNIVWRIVVPGDDDYPKAASSQAVSLRDELSDEIPY